MAREVFHHRPPGGRTMHPQRDYWTPMSPAQEAEARAAERDRKKLDPGYVTAAEAGQLPRTPENVDRIAASQPSWPELRMPMNRLDLEPDTGASHERRAVEAATLFQGGPVGGSKE